MTNKIFKKNLHNVSGFRTFPDSWRPISINQIFNLGRGRVISQEEIQSKHGVFPVYSSQTSNNGIMGFIDSYDFHTELITWTTDGANAGTVFKREGKFNCTNVCGTLKAKSLDETDLTFFKYHLGRISKNYVSYIGNPKLMNDVMGKISLPIPDINHQRKIAKILNTADAVIEKTEATIAKYRAIKQGMMQDLFTRGIDLQTGQLRPVYEDAPHLYKETELGWIPKEWDDVPFEKFMTKLINGGTPSTEVKSYWRGRTPWVTGADFLENFQIGKIRRHITPEAIRNSSTNLIPKGEILLLTRTGVGKMAIAPFDICISQDITGLIINKEVANTNFLFYYLQVLVQEFMKLNQGTSIKGITRSDLLNRKVIKPEKKEQQEIANRLGRIDQLIEKEQANLAKHQSLKKGLMQDLLTGKVEVEV